jgi:glucose/mannose-6-phosphate isomerase
VSAAGLPLDRASVEAVDPGGMLEDVLNQPHQLEDAVWRVDSVAIPPVDAPGGLVVCGMGGSAIGADLARGAIGDRARRPLVISRDYAPPSWVGEETLVLCASYSGDTEETLAAYRVAGDRGAARVVMTTGGPLAEAARADGVPVIGVPSGMQPRAAVAYMTVGALELAALAGVTDSLRGEIEMASILLRELALEWGPDGEPECEPKALARALRGQAPVVYGAELTAPVSVRWRSQLNENAEIPAFDGVLPEMDHNEICGWGQPTFTAIFLQDGEQHTRVMRRIELTAEVVAAAGSPVQRVRSRGQTRVERVLSLVLLGDLVSVYLAALNGVDPTPVARIEDFKQRLG